MDSSDLNTRLPPRKRLLAGLKKNDTSDCNLSLPIPLVSGELYGRLHKIINSSSSSLEEIIEEVNSVASDAVEAAKAARLNAMDKAAAAAKAKAAAKSALELVDLIRQSDDWKFGSSARNKLKKRHIEIKHLYESDGLLETDEELARKLQRAMNGSLRISNNFNKKHEISRKFESEIDSIGKLGKKKLCQSIENQYHGSKIDVGKKAKVKRKKLLLSQFNVRDRGKTEDLLTSVDNTSTLTGGSVLDNVKPFNELEVKINAEI